MFPRSSVRYTGVDDDGRRGRVGDGGVVERHRAEIGQRWLHEADDLVLLDPFGRRTGTAVGDRDGGRQARRHVREGDGPRVGRGGVLGDRGLHLVARRDRVERGRRLRVQLEPGRVAGLALDGVLCGAGLDDGRVLHPVEADPRRGPRLGGRRLHRRNDPGGTDARELGTGVDEPGPVRRLERLVLLLAREARGAVVQPVERVPSGPDRETTAGTAPMSARGKDRPPWSKELAGAMMRRAPPGRRPWSRRRPAPGRARGRERGLGVVVRRPTPMRARRIPSSTSPAPTLLGPHGSRVGRKLPELQREGSRKAGGGVNGG